MTSKFNTSLILLLFSMQVQAITAVTFKLAQLEFQDWKIQNIAIALKDLDKNQQQLILSIQQLQLPPPLQKLQFIQIRCDEFIWDARQIQCHKGKAQLKSAQLDSPQFDFSFQIKESHSYFKIQQLNLFKGKINLEAHLKQQQWQLKLNGKKIHARKLQPFLANQLSVSSGKLNFSAQANGDLNHLKKVAVQLKTQKLSLQNQAGTQAGENLNLNLKIAATNKTKFWLWETHSEFKQGDLYIEPLFLQPTESALSFDAQGAFYPQKQQLEIDSATYTHPKLGILKANALLQLSPFKLKQGSLYAEFENLEQASRTYMDAFIETSSVEGLTLKGKLNTRLRFKNNAVTEINLIAYPFGLTEPKQRFELQNSSINFNWSNQKKYTTPSYFTWEKFTLFAVPLEATHLSLLFKQKQAELLKAVQIPLLGGQFEIREFNWQAVKEDNPKIHFSGKVENISLEKLAESFAWKPLSGSISGDIPSVSFDDGLLQLNGGLKIKLFGGEINIKKLALAGLIKGFPRFHSDIEINHLSLDLLTQRFEFGGIKGTLSGYIRDLYLEDWKPIQFYAWFGTPENDEADHEISQKAVENLATIGGGGAVDIVSRLFLGLFDSFGYDKIGLGCDLSGGVCQLSGVEAAGDRSYYIVKGGGVPQINVMGYNPRVDWEVLWQRLSRIAQTNDVVVE